MKLPSNEVSEVTAIIFCAVIFMTAAGHVERDNRSRKFNSNSEIVLQSKNKPLSGYKVLKRWLMPKELLEISANVLIDETRMGCIEDNKGIIHIYNLKTQAVESKIEFEGHGDFEGLAIVGNVYYALRADGLLFEISGETKPNVKKYDLPLSIENDTESLFYDKDKNRLLIGVKEKDLSSHDKKGVYAFDLASKRMNTQAVFFIDSNLPGGDQKSKDNDNDNDDHKKNKGKIKPSEIIFHPKRGTLLILNGPSSQLMEADLSGNILSVIQLDRNDFPQPEGMCFSGSGKLYISSEGNKKQAAVIAEVELLESGSRN